MADGDPRRRGSGQQCVSCRCGQGGPSPKATMAPAARSLRQARSLDAVALDDSSLVFHTVCFALVRGRVCSQVGSGQGKQ